MQDLAQKFPSLTKFSDLDWGIVSQEYLTNHSEISFPEYLQLKAEEGDCPPYLFEIAFYELAVGEVVNPETKFPTEKGIHLNPTTLFLNFDFDIQQMLKDAAAGKIEIIERPHTLCLFRDRSGQTQHIEIEDEVLGILLDLEDGPQPNRDFISQDDLNTYQTLVKQGLILEV